MPDAPTDPELAPVGAHAGLPSRADHRARHQVLNEHLDELLADYLVHHRHATPSRTSVLELVLWSYRQTIAPEDP